MVSLIWIVLTDLVFDRAKEWYGDDLPHNIEERISKELYGDIVYKCWREIISEDNPNISDDELDSKLFENLHNTLVNGFDEVKMLVSDYVKKHWSEEDGEMTDKALDKKIKKSLGGVIGGGFDPIYLIAQRLVKHSNDEGFLVGSRGSVGSSFVATMMGITEVNPLPAHYRCLKCKNSIFKDDNGNDLGATYSSGFDLPDKICPNCGEHMYKDGQDMPFATFLGFNADKVPDIDLNFSDLNQASAHEYTKVLFGVDNVYRAGTIGTVAEKTAFGFVKGYFEDKGIMNKRSCEIERLAMGCTGVKRTTGQHPGGIVVVPDYMDVSDFTPFQFPAEDPTSAWRTTHFDYHAIDQDLLKLDILGHSDPTQLRLIQELSGTDILKVPLDDKDTMSIFTSTKVLGVTNEQIMCDTGTLGIPEFGTPFTISMVAETKPTTFAELIKISGLSHGTDVWLGNAQELIKNNIVPFKDVIGCRDDIMVYLMYHGVEPIKAFKIMEFVRKGKASKDPETWAKHKETMEKAGIVNQDGSEVEDYYIEEPIFVAEGEGLVLAMPDSQYNLEGAVSYASEQVGSQRFRYCGYDNFVTHVAPARTFGFWSEVKTLLENGLGQGGDLSNALIYDRPGFDVKKSQRFVNEPVRHKVLDLAGDLCLLGRPLRAFVLAVRAGHKLHVEFVRKVAEEMRKNA